MRRKWLLVIVIGLLLGADQPKKDPSRDDLGRLQGTWILESKVADGKEFGKKSLKAYRVVIKGDTWTFLNGPETMSRMKFELGAAGPKTIDQVEKFVAAEDEIRNVFKGIYHLDGDTLIVATGKERPRDFKARAGSGATLVIYSRSTQ